MPDQAVPGLDPDQTPTKLGDSEITEFRSEDGTTKRLLASVQILDQTGQVMDVWKATLYSDDPEEADLDTFTNAELSERSASHERLRVKAATAWSLTNEVPA